MAPCSGDHIVCILSCYVLARFRSLSLEFPKITKWEEHSGSFIVWNELNVQDTGSTYKNKKCGIKVEEERTLDQ
jgi:hypothetical protein